MKNKVLEEDAKKSERWIRNAKNSTPKGVKETRTNHEK